MNYYANISIITCYLACITLCVGCRSSYSRNNKSETHSKLNYTGNMSYTSAGTVSSQTYNTKENDSNWYRIAYTFDTSKPADPSTGLPPISNLSVEGSQATSKDTQRVNNYTHSQDSIQASAELNHNVDSTTSGNAAHQGGVLSGIDQGIKTGLSIGIPVFFILLSLLVYARIRKKNSSK